MCWPHGAQYEPKVKSESRVFVVCVRVMIFVCPSGMAAVYTKLVYNVCRILMSTLGKTVGIPMLEHDLC